MYLFVFAYDSNRYIILIEWSAISHGLLISITNNSNWSIINKTILISIYSNNTNEWLFVNEDHILSNVFLFDTDRNVNSYISTISQEWYYQFCKPNRKSFHSVKAYQAHVNSVVYVSKIFYCLLLFISKIKVLDLLKTRSFSTLGELIQYLESGKCKDGFEIYHKAIIFVKK
ncbi:hypothetical protein EAE96_009798 [Botrytis aclada]|nr:hypothetical protein EAE96_009798 [Botrytis aclada]